MRASTATWLVTCLGLTVTAAPGCDREPAPAGGGQTTSQARAGVLTTEPAASPSQGRPGPGVDVPSGEPAPSPPTAGEGEGEDSGEHDCPPPEAVLDPVQILRFQFTSAVESKNATDKLNVARPGQRIWAHLTVRNRTGRARCLQLVFRVDGNERTRVELEVGHSWSWRTWAYNTLRPSDRSGRLELEVLDERAERVAMHTLPIVPAPAP